MAGIFDSLNYQAFIHPEARSSTISSQIYQGQGMVALNPDSIHKVTGTFFPERHIEMIQIIHPIIHQDWMTWSLLILFFSLAIIWFYTPGQLLSVFSFSDKKGYFRHGRQPSDLTPGILVKIFFTMNFWFTLTLIVYLVINYFMPGLTIIFKPAEQLLYITGAIILLYFYRYLFITVTGFIFNSTSIAFLQLKLYQHTDNATGVILIPLLLLFLVADIKSIIYLGIFFIVFIHIFRWFQSYRLSKNSSSFSALHLFMYLCTLEIIPFLLLVKLFERYIV